jgi:hypothetical protein
VFGENVNGCTASSLVPVNPQTAPSISITAGTGTVCAGETVYLKASGATSYTWSNLQTGSQASFTPMSTSMYFVIGSNGCTNIAIYTQSVDLCLDVKSQSELYGVSVYPNPGNGSYVIAGGAEIQSVTIVDVTGRVVLVTEGKTKETQVDIREHPPGIYIADIECAQGHVLKKLIKE